MKSIAVNCEYFLDLYQLSNTHLNPTFASYNDELESELSRELENGRLVRLMAKMGFINERPE